MPTLVDTGILLRGFARTDPQYRDIRQALRTLRRQGDELLTSFQNIAEFINVSTRPTSSRGGYGLSLEKTDKRVRFIAIACRVVMESPASYDCWRELVARYGVHGVAVHDARIIAVMLVNGAQRLLTLNERDFRRYGSEGITIVTPQSLIDTSSAN
jgi:predicted nucleic acid-binding protein